MDTPGWLATYFILKFCKGMKLNYFFTFIFGRITYKTTWSLELPNLNGLVCGCYKM